MGFSIRAEFALGTYQARSPSGAPEPYPGVDRLFAAFTAAAGAGPQAAFSDGSLEPIPAHRVALEWLEANPPDSISIPDYRFNVPNVTAYRLTGLRSKGSYGSPASRDAVARSSFAAPLVWSWRETPSPKIMGALGELAAEVAYLGEANSPVVVTVADRTTEPDGSLLRVPDDELFPAGGVPIATPVPGRLRWLEQAHKDQLAVVSGAESAPPQNEEERQANWSREGVRLRWYRHQERDDSADSMPWRGAVILDVQPIEDGTRWPPTADMRVAWAVALHRALARALDPDAPPLVTGRHPHGILLPPNRLAIQLVSKEDPVGWERSRGVEASFALLLPTGASPQDQAAVIAGVQALEGRKLYLGRAGSVRLGQWRIVEAGEFWRAVPEGAKRLFTPLPLAVAETRSQRFPDGRRWGLREAALLSVGMVWRDILGVTGKGGAFYQSLVAAADELVRVHRPRQVVGQDLVKFVHRISPSTVLTAYTAMFEFSSAVSVTAPVAIGQARHLGNGLLIPVDVPASLFDERGELAWI